MLEIVKPYIQNILEVLSQIITDDKNKNDEKLLLDAHVCQIILQGCLNNNINKDDRKLLEIALDNILQYGLNNNLNSLIMSIYFVQGGFGLKNELPAAKFVPEGAKVVWSILRNLKEKSELQSQEIKVPLPTGISNEAHNIAASPLNESGSVPEVYIGKSYPDKERSREKIMQVDNSPPRNCNWTSYRGQVIDKNKGGSKVELKRCIERHDANKGYREFILNTNNSSRGKSKD